MTAYRKSLQIAVMVRQTKKILREVKPRSLRDNRAKWNIATNLAIAIENLRDAARGLRYLNAK